MTVQINMIRYYNLFISMNIDIYRWEWEEGKGSGRGEGKRERKGKGREILGKGEVKVDGERRGKRRGRGRKTIKLKTTSWMTKIFFIKWRILNNNTIFRLPILKLWIY